MRRSLDAGDSAALQAALSLLDDMRDGGDVDDWFFGGDAGGGGDSPDSSGGASVEDDATANGNNVPAAASAIRKPARKRQRHRYRHKDEIAYLRNKVGELERVLATTNGRIAEAQGIPTRDLELVSIWQEFASRQRHKRLASETENAKLREMLVSQVQVARQLLQFLERQPREEDIPGVRALKRLAIAALDVAECNHDGLLHRMDALYAKAAEVFDADPSWTTRRTLQSVNVRDSNDGDNDAVVVDIRTAWVVPFELEVVAKVMRERSDRTTIQAQCADFQTLEEKDRILVSIFSGGVQYENADHTGVNFRGRIVSRYYPEPDNTRVVIVSELNVQPLASPGSNIPAYAVQSQGWIRLQPYRPHGELLQSDTTQLTQIQWFRSVRILPRSLDTGRRRPEAGVFTEIVLSHIQRDLDESRQVIEDLLLQDDAEQELPTLADLY